MRRAYSRAAMCAYSPRRPPVPQLTTLSRLCKGGGARRRPPARGCSHHFRAGACGGRGNVHGRDRDQEAGSAQAASPGAAAQAPASPVLRDRSARRGQLERPADASKGAPVAPPLSRCDCLSSRPLSLFCRFYKRSLTCPRRLRIGLTACTSRAGRARTRKLPGTRTVPDNLTT